MKDKQMLCPCCGVNLINLETECACGAKAVGHPLTEPEWVAPKLGFGIGAIIFALSGLLMFWIKPLGLIALVGLYLAVKGRRRHRAEPQRFGGGRLLRWGLALSLIMLTANVTWLIAGIPKAIRNYHARRFHQTVANMESLAGLLREYRRQYGTYPAQDLGDLRLITAKPIPLTDYWEQELRYTSTSLIAAKSRRMPPPLTNFEIRSAGGDGLYGTDDDIIMQDDHIITAAEANPILQEAAPVEETPTPAKSKRSGRRPNN